MKKILSILMLVALFVSCSSDDDNDPGNNGNGNNMIDEKIIGKWKVEYSKTIKGARFLEDGTLEVGKDSEVVEYMGNFGEPDIVPNSGIFDPKEYKIEIRKDNKIISTVAENNPLKIINYKIENGFLKWIIPSIDEVQDHKYRLENDKLIIERIPNTKNKYWYVISEYSRIAE